MPSSSVFRSKCTPGQKIPKPDRCNVCDCDEGHIVCTNFECRPLHKPSSAENATTVTDGETTTNKETAVEDEATTVTEAVLDEGIVINTRFAEDDSSSEDEMSAEDAVDEKPAVAAVPIFKGPSTYRETATDKEAIADKEGAIEKGAIADRGSIIDQETTTVKGTTATQVNVIYKVNTKGEGTAINKKPSIEGRFGVDEEVATGVAEDLKECEADVYIPPPPPPLDCNKCVCVNHQVLCSMDSCNEDVPGSYIFLSSPLCPTAWHRPPPNPSTILCSGPHGTSMLENVKIILD
ncbi:uncharacterized protein LOC113500209 [Trichoplusia ni]|uniref:Uncharacterized protein LOC113500209 n=1 Tax=Trichoplusia ni TaxID=7111 RepID=A0A7E5W7W7_TRINI|nr:uncharacterized protein LOC113500209 [Trichoplusia ni]